MSGCVSANSLSSEETQALVRAMESNIETVVLGFEDEVSLDITALTQYSGKGKCQIVYWGNIFFDKYEAELRSWVKRTDSRLEKYESTMNPTVRYTLFMRGNFKRFCRLANYVLPFPII